jgi:hypothetical protein
MSKSRITEIAVETEETLTVRIHRTIATRCYMCKADVAMVRPETAARLTGLRPREIYRRVEAGTVHFRESVDGNVYVCLDSIASS